MGKEMTHNLLERSSDSLYRAITKAVKRGRLTALVIISRRLSIDVLSA